jgi:hypothetical protein
MTNPSIRAAFEKWYGGYHEDVHGHAEVIKQARWEAWQAATSAVMQWMPIDTFPKYQLDTTVLLFDGKKVVAGYFRDEELSGFYYHDYPDDYNLDGIKPTHWMPLPAPPAPPSETNEEK